MTPTDFTFLLTMPGDARLIGAVRQLATQAAGYAQLTPDAAEGLAGHVERATQAAIATNADSVSLHRRRARHRRGDFQRARRGGAAAAIVGDWRRHD
jgi:hypothetical protein